MADLQIYASPFPFSNKQVKAYAPFGSSVQEIVDQICPPQLRGESVGAVVYINGHAIFRKHWSSIRPKPGTIINVRIVPLGGGGKNPIASLLGIAVMIAAPYLGAALGTSLGLSVMGTGVLTAGQTLFFNSLVSAGVGILGKLAISALAPPPKPSNLGQVSNPAQSPTQFIEGAQNSIDPFGVVPICLGVNRYVPKQAARPFTESKDDAQYVRQLFTWGYGKVVVSDLRIGETLITDFTDFQLEHRLDGDLHLGTQLYSNDVFQEDYNVLLQEVDGFTTRTTRQDVDEAVVDITFPQGLSEFNSQGKRLTREVRLEVQYALAGQSPQVWSTGATSFEEYPGKVLTVAEPPVLFVRGVGYIGYRRDLVVVDILSGEIKLVKGATVSGTPEGATAPTQPENTLRVSTLLVRSTRPSSDIVTTIVSHTDDRQPTDLGVVYGDDEDFEVSVAGKNATVSDGSLKANLLIVKASQTEALRKSIRMVFPERGTYDVRVRRLTEDSDDDQIFDKVSLTALKSVTYIQPVNLEGISGTAVLIKATEQLNGALSQFNGIVSAIVLDYSGTPGEWAEAITSNPASLYRYVLQGGANAKPLPDSKINIADLEAWHDHCVEQGYSYNRIIDYETSVDEILRDIASAGAASPAIVDGKRTIVIDRVKDDIVQLVTPRNSWDYSGEMLYSDLPHAFRVQFRNKDKGYVQDERIVYDDGYNEANASIFEGLELQSCTDADLAFKTGRRHIASARLRPETHTFMMDVENLVFLRGDRIKLEHDVPIVGVGDGRVKEVFTDGGSPELITGFSLDDTITIPRSATYNARVRLADGTFLYKQLVTAQGSYTSFNFLTPFVVPYSTDGDRLFTPGDLVAVAETGGELDLIVTRIEPQDDLTARITAVNYAPEIFVAENAAIPPFDSKVTTPLEFIRPEPPVLLSAQSDETAMLRNSDGTFTPRAVFTLENVNEGDIITSAFVRVSGTNVFTNANVLEATPERLVLTGLEDGTNYDIHIRYKRVGGSMYSVPLQLNNYLFIGASGLPADVTGFKINVAGSTAILQWDANQDIDLSHYIVKFSGVFSGASWSTAQTLEAFVYENRLTLPFQSGTYLVKAVDLSGNVSANATAIITYDAGLVANAVEVLNENPTFAGTKDNVVIDGTGIVLADTDFEGYYYFDNDIDLTAVYTSFVSSSIIATGAYVNNLFDIADIFAEGDVFGSGGNDLFLEADIFAMSDVFGIGADGWAIELQYRTTNDDPSGSPVWSDWTAFTAGNIEFRGAEFRIKLTSLAQGVSPKVTLLSVTVDMPDRIERGEDLPVDATLGATITYDTPFKSNPSVVITIQDGDANDQIEFVSKTSGGFSFKVYNNTTAGYVSRTYDFIASGYGRESP